MAKKKVAAAEAEAESGVAATVVKAESRRVAGKPRAKAAEASAAPAALETGSELAPDLDPVAARRGTAASSAENDAIAFSLDGENPEWTEGDEWVEDIDSAYLQSKYTLVSVAAKRARQLLGGSKRRVDSLSEKPVTVALEELSQGKLIFERTRDGIK